MKTLRLVVALLISLLVASEAWAPPPVPPKPYLDTNCNQARYYPLGSLCQDTDDGKLYLGLGDSVTELAVSTGEGDITDVWNCATGDCQALAAGAADSLDATSASYSIPWVVTTDCSAVVAEGRSCWDSDDNVLYIGNTTTQSRFDPFTAASYVAKALFDAYTILYATADNTPAALTVTEQTVVGRATGGAIAALAIDSDLSTVSGNDDTVPSAKAAKAYFQPLDSDLTTYAGITPTANAQTLLGETFAQMQASLSIDDLITLSGVAEGATHLGTFTGTTIDDSVTIKAALQALETAVETKGIGDVTGSGDCSSGACGDGTSDGGTYYRFYDGTANYLQVGTQASALGADKILYFPITVSDGQYLKVGVSGNTWTLSGDTPGGTGDVSGVGDCASGACGDGSSDGGTYYRFYDGNSHYTQIQAGDSIANLTFTFPTAAAGGNNYLLNFDADGTGGFTDPATFQSADADLAAIAALSVADGKILIGNSSPAWSLSTFTVPATPTANKVLYGDGTNYVLSTPTVPLSSSPAAGNIMMGDGTNWTSATTLTGAYTFSGNLIMGDADTDTVTIRSLLAGGNSRAVQIAAAIAAPTYATGAYSLYVESYIESATGIIAPFFESFLTPGNVGFSKFKEDPTYGSNYRGFTVTGGVDYVESLEWVIPTGVPSANDIPVFGAVAANQTTISYKTLPELLDTVLGNTQGNILYRNDTTWTVLAPGSSGQALTSGGAAANVSWENVTATAAGETGYVQYNTTDALDGEAAFAYNASTNTLTVGNYIGNIDGVYVASQAAGDLLTGASGTTLTRIAAVAAGQPLLSGGLATAPAYAGYTLSGTAAQTYTFPSATASLAPLTSPVFLTSLALPQGDNPTTDAAGEIAMDSTAGAIQGLNVYANATPGAIRIPFYYPDSMTIKDPVSTSDYPLRYAEYAITLRAVRYIAVGGTNWIGQIQICDANYGSCTDTQAADSTVTPGTTVSVTSFSDATIPAGVWYGLKTFSSSGSPTSITASYSYTVDQQ